jgi:hypothetical protein
MASDTRTRSDLQSLRSTLDDLRTDPDATGGLFVRAMDSFLTAAAHQDHVLMRSALEEARTVLGESVIASVKRLVGRSSTSRERLRTFTDTLEGKTVEPDEQFDAVGRSVADLVGTVLNSLTGFRNGPLAMLGKHGIEVPDAGTLDEHIAHWQAVKADLVDLWPWSTGPIPLPPADREMIARSRAAFAAGEKGEELDALIARLRSELTSPGKGE